MSREEKVVGITGASGFIASWIVKLLLQRGYTVKASVLDLSDPKQTQHLLELDGAKARLQLFEANLLKEGSFDSLVNGCEGVFHTASPVLFSPIDPQKELIDPAVKGTLNVLRSCAKCPSIKRVVLTSSLAAIAFSREAMALIELDKGIDETSFSDPDFCIESKLWYMLSKTLAEKGAWKFAREKGIDLVTTNAGFAIGPMLQPTLNFTVEMILNLINGNQNTYPNQTYPCVDVRDVALAHILALENPSASGRNCLVGHNLHYSKVLDILHQLYPTLPIAQKCEDNKPLAQEYRVSKEKAKNLGIEFTPLEVTLRDTVENIKEKGFLYIN